MERNKECTDCLHYELCQALEDNHQANKIKPIQCGLFKERSKFVEMPCEIGSEVFVSPDNGENFHKANLYGCDKKGVFLVFVNDNKLKESEKHIVKNPMKKVFYDWFSKVYSKEEAEQALAERSGK